MTELELKTKIASLSMMVAGLQADRAILVQRAKQAEEMTSLLQTGAVAQQVFELIVRHMDQAQQTLAQHQLNLIQTTAVSLSAALKGSDEELRQLVNTVANGLGRAVDTMTKIKLEDNKKAVQRNQSTNREGQ